MDPGRRFVVLSAMRWFSVGLVIPVLVLLLGSRGLSLAQVGQVLALYSVVTLALELPTGGMADSWGRRPVIVLSALLQSAGLLVLALLGTVPFIILGTVLLATARALASGPVEAWYVDVMHAAGREDVEAGLARGQVAESLALGMGAVAGGLLPRMAGGWPVTGTGLIQLSLPFLLAGGAALAHAVAAYLLITRQERLRRSVRRTVGDALRLAWTQPGVRRVLLVAACLGVVLAGVELLAPNRFAELAGGPTNAAAVFGVLSAAAFGAAALGAGLSTRLPGARTLVGAGAFLAMGLLVLGLSVPVLGGAAVMYLGVYVAIGVQGPVMAGLLHGRVGGEVRSTMMSVESLVLQAGGAVASLTIGAVATGSGTLAALVLLMVVGLLAAAILLRDRAAAV